MDAQGLTVALITEVYPGPGSGLSGRLGEAAGRGADLAVLPELPLDRWAPAGRDPDPADAEDPPPQGRRARRLAEAARAAGLWVLGGAIVRDPASGVRRNTALLVDPAGDVRASYAKVHLPQEPGFWEQCHYEPGDEPPRPVSLGPDGPSVGLQICSDINRPEGGQLLAAAGAEAILVPRATETRTWPRWRVVLRATALTTGCYVVSVNRPRLRIESPQAETVTIGGPSVVVDPDGAILVETTEPLVLAPLDRARPAAARGAYPGYLARPAGLYAAAWGELAPSPPQGMARRRR